jgi:site-specific recombinase XerD
MDRNESLAKFEAYLQRRFPERRTPIDYVSDVRQFMAVCPKPWREVTMHDIDAFVDQQRTSGLQPTTVNRRVAALKTFFDFLAEESDDLSWPNPVHFKRHAGKRPRALPRDVRDEDIERVWGVIVSARDRAWFALMVRAGLRVGEVVSLKVGDVVSPAAGERPARVRVCGKGRKERMVLLGADAYAVLETWLHARPTTDDPHVFLNERGKPLSASGVQWLLHQYGQQVGLDLTPHQLRHTFARQLTEAGMPITSLGKLLGHAQITTTQIYTAGADPALAQAYQTAMSHLAERSAPGGLSQRDPGCCGTRGTSIPSGVGGDKHTRVAQVGHLGNAPARGHPAGQLDVCPAPLADLGRCAPDTPGAKRVERPGPSVGLVLGTSSIDPTGRTKPERPVGLSDRPTGTGVCRWDDQPSPGLPPGDPA